MEGACCRNKPLDPPCLLPTKKYTWGVCCLPRFAKSSSSFPSKSLLETPSSLYGNAC